MKCERCETLDGVENKKVDTPDGPDRFNLCHDCYMRLWKEGLKHRQKGDWSGFE